MAEELLIGLTFVIALGIGAQWLAWRLRLPAILLLLLFGCLAGPGSDWLARRGWIEEQLLDPDYLLGALLLPIVSLSVAVILFEGGLTLKLRELSVAGRAIWQLVSVGAIVTWILGAALARWTIGLDWSLAALLGAILVVTGPTVIGPLLNHVRPSGRVGPIVKWEGIVNDPIGAMLAVLVFEAIPMISDRGVTLTWMVRGVAMTVAVGIILGAIGAAALVLLLRRRFLPDELDTPVTLAIVVCVFTASNVVQEESGLFAVTAMGVILANQRLAPVHHIAEFKETLTLLLVSMLFIIIGSRLTLEQLGQMDWRHLLLVTGLIAIVRPVAVLASSLGTDLSWRERAFVAWMAPRGVVAAAVTSVFSLRLADAGHAGAAMLMPTIFAVILGTVAVYGLTAAPLARWLGLANPRSAGFLIVGAGPAARLIAKALAAEGIEILMVDTNPQNVAAARMDGIPVFYGSVTSHEAARRIELTSIGRLLALTPNDEVNALAALQFARVLGRSDVYQLASPGDQKSPREKAPPSLRGRILFGRDITHADLENRVAGGATVKKTKLTNEFDVQRFVETQGPEAIPLFVVSPGDGVSVVTAEKRPSPKAGESLIYLADPHRARAEARDVQRSAGPAAAV